MTTDRKARIREYKESALPAGVFVVRNMATGMVLLGTSPNLPGMLNRQRFQLEAGSHPDKELQRDWNELGPESFEFAVLDELEPSSEPDHDTASDLRALKELWLDKLNASEQPLYPFSVRGT